MSPIELLKMLCALEDGIMPFTGKDVKAALATLPPSERRKAKRRFRKAWRRLQDDFVDTMWAFPESEQERGHPSAVTKRQRQNMVFRGYTFRAHDFLERKVKR